MDFALSKKQQELQERAREAVTRVVLPIVAEVKDGSILSRDQVSRIYQGLVPTGYVGSTISPDQASRCSASSAAASSEQAMPPFMSHTPRP